eukprot:TRINITY_DN62032_c0_g1_i4.p2 TRINITY_DN62032_c0_g1~~TRINITY_DN62032_c0_g1_i4.p2  ORF type:complete len:245 (-),score=116.26 TRINITY_DN62032_c0_g1_i4:232-966(-)
MATRDLKEHMAVWNRRVHVSFESTGIHGWPKFFVEVYFQDEHGRIDLCGYGFCFLPTSPGLHNRTIAVFRPRGTTTEALAARFLGGYPQYEKPDVVMNPQSRFGHRTESTGWVHLQVSVVVRGFGQHVELSSDPTIAQVSAHANVMFPAPEQKKKKKKAEHQAAEDEQQEKSVKKTKNKEEDEDEAEARGDDDSSGGESEQKSRAGDGDADDNENDSSSVSSARGSGDDESSDKKTDAKQEDDD